MIYLSKFKVEGFINENGKEVKKNFSILVDSETFGDVEVKTIKYAEERHNIFALKKIDPTKYENIHFEDEDGIYFDVKIVFMSNDENTGKEKEVSESIIVVTKDSETCNAFISTLMKDVMIPWRIAHVKETKISDYLPYSEN